MQIPTTFNRCFSHQNQLSTKNRCEKHQRAYRYDFGEATGCQVFTAANHTEGTVGTLKAMDPD